MHVEAIRLYPVKSMRGIDLDEARVERIGLEGDRRWMVVDDAGVFLTLREAPRLAEIVPEQGGEAAALTLTHAEVGRVPLTPDPRAAPATVRVWNDRVEAHPANREASAFVSAVLDREVRLVHLADPSARPVDPAYAAKDDRVSFADGFPILITNEGSLDDLNARLDHPVPMDRFRPNIVVRTDAWQEDGWGTLLIDSLRLEVAKPCGRCVITTRDQHSGEQLNGNEPLRTLGTFRRRPPYGIVFGQNLIARETGMIRLGDPVEITSAFGN